MTRTGEGPRRRRTIRGTIARIGVVAMRYGRSSQLARIDCTSSRRSTVMCALPWATAVTTVYQRDSSSKRPQILRRLRGPRTKLRRRYDVANTASRASRPAGGACGAPGPRARHVVGGSYASKLTLARQRAKPPSKDRGLTRGHSISATCRLIVIYETTITCLDWCAETRARRPVVRQASARAWSARFVTEERGAI